MIYEQTSLNNDQLYQWCQDNGLYITNDLDEDECGDEDEYEYEDDDELQNKYQLKIYLILRQSGDINLLNKFWEFTVNRRLAFVYKRTIDRKCYLKTIDNYEIDLAM